MLHLLMNVNFSFSYSIDFRCFTLALDCHFLFLFLSVRCWGFGGCFVMWRTAFCVSPADYWTFLLLKRRRRGAHDIFLECFFYLLWLIGSSESLISSTKHFFNTFFTLVCGLLNHTTAKTIKIQYFKDPTQAIMMMIPINFLLLNK